MSRARHPGDRIIRIKGAVMGSFYMLVVTVLLSFPIGVAAAIYLEEFAPRNRWSDLIEVNINNLAAVPSIVYGLLGLAVFLNFSLGLLIALLYNDPQFPGRKLIRTVLLVPYTIPVLITLFVLYAAVLSIGTFFPNSFAF